MDENSKFNPQELINRLKKMVNLNQIYQQKVRHYVLERHTLLVMQEFEKYFSQVTMPVKRNLFRLMLALHDVGKPRAYLEGCINNQYMYTVSIINSIRSSLPFSADEIDLCIALVGGDVLGNYLQNKINLETAQKQIADLAEKSSIPVTVFFKLLTIYYQCDTAAYTADAGGLHYLEHLFVYQNSVKFFDNASDRLKFSPAFEIKFLELEKALMR